jgi:hypothetical protein
MKMQSKPTSNGLRHSGTCGLKQETQNEKTNLNPSRVARELNFDMYLSYFLNEVNNNFVENY